MIEPTKIIAENESCCITRCSEDYEAMFNYKHEVHDTERGELLSSWKSSKRLLDRLDEADHRLADDFREWYESSE